MRAGIALMKQLSEAGGGSYVVDMHTEPPLTRAEFDSLTGSETVYHSKDRVVKSRFYSSKDVARGTGISRVTIYCDEAPPEGWPKLKPGTSAPRAYRQEATP